MSAEKEVKDVKTEVEAEEPTGCKVFVGNLSFKTTPEGLKAFFQDCGEITNTSVITRGRRSLGYGFVDFAEKDSADKALETLNKKELDGREINLEIAKPRDPSKPRPARQNNGGFRRRQGSYRGGRDFDNRRPPPRRFDGPPPRRNNYDGGYRVSGYRGDGYRGDGYRGDGYRDNYNRGYPRREYRDDRRREYRPRSRPRSEPRNEEGYQRGYNRRRSNNRRRRESEKDREPSTTTLFVTNLPFAITDETLKDVFNGFDTVKCYVVTRRNGRSKGYGFVEFKNADDQKAALDAVNGKTVEGRELVVKIAYSSQTGEHNNDEEKN